MSVDEVMLSSCLILIGLSRVGVGDHNPSFVERGGGGFYEHTCNAQGKRVRGVCSRRVQIKYVSYMCGCGLVTWDLQ